jgi:hypothetical protein
MMTTPINVSSSHAFFEKGGVSNNRKQGERDNGTMRENRMY